MGVLAFVVGFVAFFSGLFPVVPHDDVPVDAADAATQSVERAQDARAMLAALNAERAENGLAALSFDARLCDIARSHARDMVRRRYFGHVDPDGVDPFGRMRRSHYPFGFAGENIALDAGVDAADRALFASLEHRANILQPHFNRVGIAAVSSTNGEVFVEDFSD
jgi:uncharacterized protein YkwD